MIPFFLLIVLKVIFGFFGVVMLVRILISPGFAQLQFEGERKKKPILRNNIIFTIVCWLIFYLMDTYGINIL